MGSRWILVTGFGPFPGVALNPSREIARALELDPPAGFRVRSAELPVTFLGVAPAIDRALASLPGEPPSAVLGLGVQSKGRHFRLERRARGRLSGDRADNDGRSTAELDLDAGEDLATELDLDPLAEALRRSGAREVEISSDAGGYVCERTYHHLLLRSKVLGVPAVFLHLPPVEVLATEAQIPIVRGLLEPLSALAKVR
jgi:pyroglutamyl-peptidase